MKKYINYIKESKEDEYEKLFLELAHLDELEIKFDFIRYKIDLYYFYNNNINFFDISKRDNIFYTNYDEIWKFFNNFFKKPKDVWNNKDEITLMLTPIVEKYFKLKDITITSAYHTTSVEMYFNN